jgi:hypothetical protein
MPLNCDGGVHVTRAGQIIDAASAVVYLSEGAHGSCARAPRQRQDFWRRRQRRQSAGHFRQRRQRGMPTTAERLSTRLSAGVLS